MEGADKTIADEIERNLDQMADGIIALWFEKHPTSSMHSMNESDLRAWTIDELRELASVIRGEPAVPRNALLYAGDFIKNVGPVFSPLANFISGKLFTSETIATLAWESFSGNPRHAQEAIAAVERATLEILRVNLHHFADTALAPGCLSQTWTMGPVAAKAERTAVGSSDSGLSKRESQVIALAVEGKTNGEIAAALGIARNTVKNHLARIYDKLGVNNRTELARYALKNGLIKEE